MAQWQQHTAWQDFSYNLFIAGKNLLATLPGERPRWISIDLTGNYPCRKAKQQFLQHLPFLTQQQSLEELAQDIEALIEAPWLEGVHFRFQQLNLGLSQALAIRQLLLRLKDAGKQSHVSSSQLDLNSYVLASAADAIILPESAELELLGFSIDRLYQRDAWARFGISFQKLAIEEYKTAFETNTLSAMSEANREQLNQLADRLEGCLVETIAEARQVSHETVKSWIDEGISSSSRALEVGMIDRVAYEDEWHDQKHQSLSNSQRFLRAPRRRIAEGRIAVISLEGTIMTGKSRHFPLPLPLIGDKRAGSDSLLAAFRKAEQDKATKAIVFYVDSGGGSALASDLIWREVKRIGATKPIVAVMGSVAASGGYYVLTHAQEIIASAATITGSIGVLSAKVVMQGFYERYGFHVESISRGALARTMKANRPFSDQEEAYVKRTLEEVYDRFTRRVAEGRGLTRARVHQLGRGRIWSGQDALEQGLVDRIGDINLAIQRARELANLSPQAMTWNVHEENNSLPQPANTEALLTYMLPFTQEQAWLTSDIMLKPS